jgi:hypothetical protein
MNVMPVASQGKFNRPTYSVFGSTRTKSQLKTLDQTSGFDLFLSLAEFSMLISSMLNMRLTFC